MPGEEGRVVAEEGGDVGDFGAVDGEDDVAFLQAGFRERRDGGNVEDESTFEVGEAEGGDFAEVGERADRGAEPRARGGVARGRGVARRRGGGRRRVKWTLESFRHLGGEVRGARGDGPAGLLRRCASRNDRQNLEHAGSVELRRVGAPEEFFGDRDDAEVHRAAVGGDFGGLDLDAGAVGAEGRVRVVGGGALVVGGEEDHFVGAPIDQVNITLEIVADGPAPVRRAVDVPEAAAGFCLAGEAHLARAEIHDTEAGGVFAGAGNTPVVVHAGFAMTHDGEGDFVPGDDGFVRDPVEGRFGPERAQAGAVGEDGPGALGGFAAGLPAEDDFAGNPGIRLHVADLKRDGDDEGGFAGLEVHAREAGGAGAQVARAEGGFGLGAGREVLRGEVFIADAEVDEVFRRIEGDIADGAELGRDGAADVFVGGGGLKFARGAVGEKFGEVGADDLRESARAAATPAVAGGGCAGRRWIGARSAGGGDGVGVGGRRGGFAGKREDAQKVEAHRMVGEAEHAGEAGLGDLHEVAARFVDGHRLAGDAVGAEDEPLAVGGPLVVRLVDLGIARGSGREKRERDAGDFVDDDSFSEGKRVPIWAETAVNMKRKARARRGAGHG